MKYSFTPNGDLLFKIDKDVTNYSQRNNQFVYNHPKTGKKIVDGLSMCNVTAYAEAAEINKFTFPGGRYLQPEDNLGEFILTNKDVLAYYKRKMPAMYDAFERGDDGAYNPNEVHAVLAYGFNKWMGCSDDKPIATFYDNAPITTILAKIIDDDSAVVMSGTFPYKYASGKIGTLGHINVLVGLQYSKTVLDTFKITTDVSSIANNIKKVTPTYLIFDDPYGNYSKNFQSGTGNDVSMPYSDFIKLYKPLNDKTIKFAHIFNKAAATI
jgi:hypothetical protein